LPIALYLNDILVQIFSPEFHLPHLFCPEHPLRPAKTLVPIRRIYALGLLFFVDVRLLGGAKLLIQPERK
jgi:hypothetical protein